MHADVQMIFWSDPILIYNIVGLGCEAKSSYEKVQLCKKLLMYNLGKKSLCYTARVH